MSPSVFRAKGFRVYFFSREEPRAHVHVRGHGGKAKFWLLPRVELARSVGLRKNKLDMARRLVEARYREILDAWTAHFGG